MKFLEYLKEQSDISFISFNDNYPDLMSMVNGVKSGSLLVHARRNDRNIQEYKYGLEPTIGETIKDTESYQNAQYYDDFEPAELVFMADDFGWAKGNRDIVLFIKNDDNIQQHTYNGEKLYNGNIVDYEYSPMYDHDDIRFNKLPIGIETGDYYSKDIVEVVGAVATQKLQEII